MLAKIYHIIYIPHIMVQRKGKIIIPSGRKPWPHELRAAEILADAGHTVEFMPEATIHTPDIYLDGVRYEMKSPFTNKVDKIERNLKRGLRQSENIIFDSSRMIGSNDKKLHRFLVHKFRTQKQIKKLIFIDKQGRIIDIN